MRYAGLDVGKKAIGVAVGEVLATELSTINAAKDQNLYEKEGLTKAFKELGAIKEIEQIDAFVLGLPVNETNGLTEEASHIKTFGDKLGEALNAPIYFVNETLTTFMAEDLLAEQGVKPDQIAKRVHQLAAKLILQQFLEEDALS